MSPLATQRRLSLTAGAGIAAVALVLAGCSGSTGETETPDAPVGQRMTLWTADEPPDEPVELRMAVWTADETQLALFQEIADEYVEENPDLVSKVTFEPIPFEDYTTTLTTQLAGGNAPDLGWILESYAPEFVSSG